MAKTFNISTVSYATQEDALLVVANKTTTTDQIMINSIEIKPVFSTSTTTLTAPGAFGLYRFTTYTSESYENVTILSQNAGNTLPSQVVASKLAEITSVKTLLRKLMIIPIGNANFGLRALGTISPVIEATATVYKSKYGTDIEGFILNEGEGFAITSFDTTLPFNNAFYIYVKFKTTDHKTYIASDIFSATNLKGGNINDAAFTLFNGTGSGVVLQIIEIQIFDLGANTTSTYISDSPELRYSIAAHYMGGESVTPNFYNTSNTLPPYIELKRNTFQNKLTVSFDKHGFDPYFDLAYPNSNQALVRKYGTFRRTYPIFSTLAASGVNIGVNSNAINYKDITSGLNFQKSPLVINKGEVFAILASNNSIYAKYYIEANISYITTINENFYSNAS